MKRLMTFTTERTYEKTHFTMTGQAITNVLTRPDCLIARSTAERLVRYARRRLIGAGLDPDSMECKVEFNESTEYYFVHFTNAAGTDFCVNAILWDKKRHSVVVDHGLSMEESRT